MIRILRWLLVALLPFAGFLTGICFTPEPQPRWKVNFPRVMTWLGLVDDGRTILLMERSSTNADDPGSVQALVGMNAADGKEVFSQPLPDQLRSNPSLSAEVAGLSPDGKTVVLIDHDNTEVLFYDRHKKEVVKRFATKPRVPGSTVVRAIHRGNLLVTSGFTFTNDDGLKKKDYLTVWDVDTTQPKRTEQYENDIYLRALSDNGKLTHQSAATRMGYNSHTIAGTETGKELVQFEGSIWDVAWSQDQQHLYALQKEDDTISLHAYQRQDETYQLLSSRINPPDNLFAGAPGTRLLLLVKTRHSLLRGLVEHYLGSTVLSLINKVSPPEIVLNVFDAEKQARVRTLSIPDHIPNPYLRIDFYPDASLRGFYFPLDFSLAYWSFDGPTTWPRWFGLLLGVLLATLLARANLKSARLNKK